MIALPQPISGRECGECTVCCVALEINDPELQKPDDIVCQHMVPCQGCAIYAHRPMTCQTWMCGWRLIKLSDSLRPDRSNILLVPEIGTTPGYEGKGGLKIVFLDGQVPATINDELLSLAAKMVLGDVPVFLTHGSGKFAKRFIANELLKPAAKAGDKDAFINVIRSTLTRMADQVAKEKAAESAA